MRSRLVVVGALAAVVSQVKRGLDRLVRVGAVGVVPGGSPVGVHLVHGCSYGLSSRLVLEEGMTPSVETRLVIEEFEKWSGDGAALLARGGFVRPMAGTPNSAARWPYLKSLATAANKYEVPPHGPSRVERIAGGRS
jgi:hypothetical protein